MDGQSLSRIRKVEMRKKLQQAHSDARHMREMKREMRAKRRAARVLERRFARGKAVLLTSPLVDARKTGLGQFGRNVDNNEPL